MQADPHDLTRFVCEFKIGAYDSLARPLGSATKLMKVITFSNKELSAFRPDLRRPVANRVSRELTSADFVNTAAEAFKTFVLSFLDAEGYKCPPTKSE